jgi:hypothetical protein
MASVEMAPAKKEAETAEAERTASATDPTKETEAGLPRVEVGRALLLLALRIAG